MRAKECSGGRIELEALLAGKSAAEIEEGWLPGLAEFLARRERFLPYD
ncbi:MAG: hypothetical protein ACUVUC_12760 [Thermoguttaceae bacterium]